MENEPQSDFIGAVQRSLGARVRRLRKLSGWSQSELAAQLAIHGVEMHQTTVAKLENGQRPTTAAEIVALAAVFQISSFDELLDPDMREPDGPTLDQLNAAIVEQQDLMADLYTQLTNEQKVLNRLVAAKHMLGYGDDDA